MCKLFLTIVSLVSFVQYSGLVATDNRTVVRNENTAHVKDAPACCTLSLASRLLQQRVPLMVRLLQQ